MAAKESVVQLTFGEGLREVKVDFVKDEGTLTPRKIEHGTRLLLRAYRERLGAQQAAIRKSEDAKQKAADAAQAEADAKAEAARQKEHAANVEKQERAEFERLSKKFGAKK